jgi:hypothetical protein
MEHKLSDRQFMNGLRVELVLVPLLGQEGYLRAGATHRAI